MKFWIQSGKKNASGGALASFERWYWTVGGILEAAGLKKFQQNRKDLETVTGGEGNPMQALVEAWYAAAQEKGGSIGMEATASGDDGLLALVQSHEIGLPLRLKRDAVDDYDYSPKSFGSYIGQHKDSTFAIEYNGREIVVSMVFARRDKGGARWGLIERKVHEKLARGTRKNQQETAPPVAAKQDMPATPNGVNPRGPLPQYLKDVATPAEIKSLRGMRTNLREALIAELEQRAA